jgi:hypothetical protein
MFMGGNYLPETEEGEVEIARIEIASTTFDVTSLFAKFENGQIHYRVVDEYEGDTLTGTSEMTSDKPLTLGEMADFFIGAWSLVDVLEMNFEGVACTRFRRHRVRCFDGAGGGSWRDGSLRASSSLRLCG